MKKMFVGLVCSIVLVTAVSAFAANRSNLVLSGREVIVKHPSGMITPWIWQDPNLKTIAGNLSDYPYGVYFCCYGYYVTGLANVLEVVPEYWEAVPFTPSANMTINEVEADVEWNEGEGTDAIVLSVYNDSNGLPGKALQSWYVQSLGYNGSCCTLAVGKSKKGIAVTKGTQYWVVASTNSKDTTAFSTWDANTTDMRLHPMAYYCDDSKQGNCNGTSGKWTAAQAVVPGFAVLGQ
jgi:hypothetical protein